MTKMCTFNGLKKMKHKIYREYSIFISINVDFLSSIGLSIYLTINISRETIYSRENIIFPDYKKT